MGDGKSGGKRAGAVVSNSGKKNNSSGFTTSQGQAVEYYVSGDGMWINQYFRNDGEGFGQLSETEKVFVKELDNALDKKVNDAVLYRSVDASVIFGNDVDIDSLQGAIIYGMKDAYSQQALSKAQSVIGKTQIEKGYMSTTRSSQIAEEFGDYTGASNPIVMKINTSKNTKGADVSKATKYLASVEKNDPQKETLLARNQQYKVNKIYSKNGLIYVDVNMK